MPKSSDPVAAVTFQIFGERTRGRISPLGTMMELSHLTATVVTWFCGMAPAEVHVSVIV